MGSLLNRLRALSRIRLIVGGVLVPAAALAPLAFTSCSARSSSEAVGVARQPLTSNVGAACTPDGGQCGDHASCWLLDSTAGAVNGQLCHCGIPQDGGGIDRGYVACGAECVQISTDTSHCGSCANVCPGGQNCVEGVCNGTSVSAPWTVGFSSVQAISVPAGGSLASWAHEGAVQQSINNGEFFSLVNYADSTDAGGLKGWPQYNFADAGPTSWDTSLHPMPNGSFDGGAVKPGFDPGAATSGYSGLEYLSAIGKYSNNCIGVTAHAMADIPAMDGGGYSCVNDPTDPAAIWDAPTISYDIGGTSLWVAADLPASGISVFKSNRCSGAIGSAACPTFFEPVLTGSMTHGHELVANRCTLAPSWRRARARTTRPSS